MTSLHIAKFTAKKTVETATSTAEFVADHFLIPMIATIGTTLVAGSAAAVSSYFWPAAKPTEKTSEKKSASKDEEVIEQTSKPSLANSID